MKTVHLPGDKSTPTYIAPAFPLKFISEELGKSLLMQYSEWLDGEGFMMTGDGEGGNETHDDLIEAFLRDRKPNANPQLEKFS